MELLHVEKLDDAFNRLYNECIKSNFIFNTEEINIEDAVNRYIAIDIIANDNLPNFRRSTVDGFALKSNDVRGASENMPIFLEVVGESKMGEICDIHFNEGECVYVNTGSMIPDDADCVVMVENIEHFSDTNIAVYKPVSTYTNIINIGDDYRKGDIIINKGKKISVSDIGLLSSNNIKNVLVYKKPIISIISTGNELQDIGIEHKNGMIRDINTYTLTAMCKKYDFEVFAHFLSKDDKDDIANKLKLCMNKSDIVVLSGGSSKGNKDYTYEIINEHCSSKVLTHGIAIKPGKPTITSYDSNTNTIVVGLPGHPVATIVLFKILIINLYYKLISAIDKKYYIKGKMKENVPQSPGRTTIQLVNIDNDNNVSIIYGQSGLISTLSKADGYIIIDENKEGINVGEEVKVYLI